MNLNNASVNHRRADVNNFHAEILSTVTVPHG